MEPFLGTFWTLSSAVVVLLDWLGVLFLAGGGIRQPVCHQLSEVYLALRVEEVGCRGDRRQLHQPQHSIQTHSILSISDQGASAVCSAHLDLKKVEKCSLPPVELGLWFSCFRRLFLARGTSLLLLQFDALVSVPAHTFSQSIARSCEFSPFRANLIIATHPSSLFFYLSQFIIPRCMRLP